MAQHFTDFSDSPTITERWNPTVGTVTIETSGLPSGSGTHALKLVKTGSSRYIVSWDNPGTPTGDVEVLVRWQSAAISSQSFMTYLHGSGSAGSETGYGAAVNSSTVLVRLHASSGSVSALSPSQTVTTMTSNTWYLTRMQRVGTTFQQRTWLDGGSEPGTWASTSTDASHTSGWIGVGMLPATTVWIGQIGVGTGGDPAPDAPLSADIPANLMRTQQYGPRGLTGRGGPF